MQYVVSSTIEKLYTFVVSDEVLEQFGKDVYKRQIQAHGGNVMYDEHAKTYYWYGEQIGRASCRERV